VQVRFEWLNADGEAYSSYTRAGLNNPVPMNGAIESHASLPEDLPYEFAHAVRITVDDDNVILESNEENNSWIGDLPVIFSPDLAVESIIFDPNGYAIPTITNQGETTVMQEFSVVQYWLDQDDTVIPENPVSWRVTLQYSPGQSRPMVGEGLTNVEDILPPPQAVKVRVTVDSTEEIAESDESQTSCSADCGEPVPVSTCTDSDNGPPYGSHNDASIIPDYLRLGGVCTDSTGSYTDFCNDVEGQDWMSEYYCDDDGDCRVSVYTYSDYGFSRCSAGIAIEPYCGDGTCDSDEDSSSCSSDCGVDNPPSISGSITPSVEFAGNQLTINASISDDIGIESARWYGDKILTSGVSISCSETTCEYSNSLSTGVGGTHTITFEVTDTSGQTSTDQAVFTINSCTSDDDCGGDVYSGDPSCSGDSLVQARDLGTCNNGSCSHSSWASWVVEDCSASGKTCEEESGTAQCIASSYCGDGTCDSDENSSTCASDCVAPSVVGVEGEPCYPPGGHGCQGDKQLYCYTCLESDMSSHVYCKNLSVGSTVWQFSQYCSTSNRSCQGGSCQVVCGDGICGIYENADDCPGYTDCSEPPPPAASECGNNTCEDGETADSCPEDCGGAVEGARVESDFWESLFNSLRNIFLLLV